MLCDECFHKGSAICAVITFISSPAVFILDLDIGVFKTGARNDAVGAFCNCRPLPRRTDSKKTCFPD